MNFSRANIVRLVLAAIMMIAATSAFAQDARALLNAQRKGKNVMGGYGSNPYDTTSQQGADGQQVDENGNPINGENVDSTKQKKPRKPLESYFFSDSIRALRNFQWHINRDYNSVEIEPVDTTLNLWRLDYPHYHKRLICH